MNDQLDLVMLEVLLHLLAIDIVDVQISDGQASLPSLVAIGKLWILGVEDTVHDCEVILDLLISLDMESDMGGRGGGLRDGGFEVRHVES